MRKTLIVALAAILWPVTAFCYDPPEDFRGIPFLSGPERLGDVFNIDTGGGKFGFPAFDFYKRRNENKKIGDGRAVEIRYFYLHDKLCLVEIEVLSDCQSIIDTMISAYGKPTGSRHEKNGKRSLLWGGEGEDIHVEFDYGGLSPIARIYHAPSIAEANNDGGL